MSNGQIRETFIKLTHSTRFRKILFLLLGAIVMLGLLMPLVEHGAMGARIKTEGDGLWYAITTVTGVGYGDVIPVTGLGRVVGAVLAVVGVVLFGAVMAFVSVELLRYQEDFNMRRLLERIDEQDRKLDEIKKHLDFLVKK